MTPLQAEKQTQRGRSDMPTNPNRRCPICGSPTDECGKCTTLGCHTNQETCRPPDSRVRVRAFSALIVPFETCKRDPAPLRVMRSR